MKEKLLLAIKYANEGDWDEAHKTVQSIENIYAYWIHANLHREEGDISNSRYWYSRANREFMEIDLKEERGLIKNEIEEKLE
jgi:hypothetical protein